jgi:ankyrin repeat domain-containing protein 50
MARGAHDSYHEDIMRLLLERGADPNAAHNDGWTALYAAAKNGHEAVVRLLLERGADINAAHNYGWTALYAADDNGHEADALWSVTLTSV